MLIAHTVSVSSLAWTEFELLFVATSLPVDTVRLLQTRISWALKKRLAGNTYGILIHLRTSTHGYRVSQDVTRRQTFVSPATTMARVVQLPRPDLRIHCSFEEACLSDSINLYAPESGNEQPESSPPAQSVPPQVSTLRKIFIGPDGLRAGWSLLIFVLIAGFLLRAVGFIANKMHLLPPKGTSVGEISPGFGFLAEIITFIVIFVATWIMSRIEKRPNSIYGLGGPRAVPLFFSGLAW